MQFLSPEWFDELAATIGSIAHVVELDVRVAIGQVITGSPFGTVSYTLFVGGGDPDEVIAGSVKDADATLVEDYVTARAIATGTSLNELLYGGAIKVRGDSSALLRVQPYLGEVAVGLASLAQHTQY